MTWSELEQECKWDNKVKAFANELSPVSHDIILRQLTLAQHSKDDNIKDNLVTYYLDENKKRKLVLQRKTLMHTTSPLRLPTISKSKLLLPQCLIDGRISGLHNGNIMPFGVHFLKTPHALRVYDYYMFYNECFNHDKYFSYPSSIGEFFQYKYGEDVYNCLRHTGIHQYKDINYYLASVFLKHLIEFSSFLHNKKDDHVTFVLQPNKHNERFLEYDMFNDRKDGLQLDFRKVSLDNFNFFECWDDFDKKNYCLPGALPVNLIEGIILSNNCFETYMYEKNENIASFELFIEEIKTLFPNLYIVDCTGTILFIPQNINEIEIPNILLPDGDIINNWPTIEEQVSKLVLSNKH